MPDDILTPEEVRALLEAGERRFAELRAKAPPGCAELYARVFAPLSDEDFRRVMELALLGEIRRTPLLPPLETDALPT